MQEGKSPECAPQNSGNVGGSKLEDAAARRAKLLHEKSEKARLDREKRAERHKAFLGKADARTDEIRNLLEICAKSETFGDTIGALYEPWSVKDRCVGTLIGVMCGDVLGAGVEGWSVARIAQLGPKGVHSFFPGSHMGVEEKGDQYGTYTDDTNSTLALAQSLVERQRLDPEHIAMNYCLFWKNAPFRGYPSSAQSLMQDLLDNKVTYKESGRTQFKDGSYANGGAMRICPIALAYRNANEDKFYEAVCEAVLSTHVHPEGIDGALVQAKAVQYLFHSHVGAGIFSRQEFLETLIRTAKTDTMRGHLLRLRIALDQIAHMSNAEILEHDFSNLDAQICQDLQIASFQIKAIDAMCIAVWSFMKYWFSPEVCLIKTIAVGGDTDTIACMVGGMLGALHGVSWIPKRWWDNLENEVHGRDFCVLLAEKLSSMNL